MKTISFCAWILMSVMIMQGAAMAADDGANSGGSQLRQMMHDRQQMTQDVLAMMKETMDIIRNLDRKPTLKEKQRLEEMMAKLDQIMQKEKEMAQRQDELMRRRQGTAKGM